MALRNLLIALGALALIGGLTLAVIWFSRAPATAGGAGTGAPPEGILVAARTLPSGTLLQSADIAWKSVKAGTGPPGSITRSAAGESDYLGAVTRRDFAAGDALMEIALVKAGDRAFLSAVLAPGNRAVSIAVDAPQSVAGLVLPGDRVDVILTQSFSVDTSNPGRKSVAETVLRNIRVIAVDQWLLMVVKPIAKEQRIGTTGSPIPGTITLEVSEQEAERVMVALQLGKIQLVARSLEGTATPATTLAARPTWAADVSPALTMLGRLPLGTASTPQAVPRAAPRPSGAPSSIEVMHGARTETR